MVKKDLLQVSVNGSSGHLIELNASLLKSITCGRPTYACSFVVICTGDCHVTQYDLDLRKMDLSTEQQ